MTPIVCQPTMLPPPPILNHTEPPSMISSLVANHDVRISSNDDVYAANTSLALSSKDSSNSLFVKISIAKSKLKLMKKCLVHDKMKMMFKNSTISSFKSLVSKSLMATGLSSCASAPHTSAATIINCEIQAFLIEVGTDIPIGKVVVACPGKENLNSMMLEEGIENFLLMRNMMIGKLLLFSYDGANKSIHHAIKMISFWRIDRVLAFLVDFDDAIGENINTADAANISLKKSIIVIEMVKLKQI